MRYACNFKVITTHRYFYKKSMKTLCWFIVTKIQMMLKIRMLYGHMMFIQKRFLARYHTREAKLEILENTWNKLCGKLNEENIEIKSEKMS